MKHSLPIVFAMALLATSSAQDAPITRDAEPEQSALSGISMIHQAARQLAHQQSIQADLRQQIELFGQSLVGSGTYLQKKTPQGLLTRLDWKIPVAERVASVQQICDGRFLWIRRDLLDAPTLERVDLARVRRALGQDSTKPASPVAWEDLAIVGLPLMLRELTDFFEFERPRLAQLGDIRVWVVQGDWNPPNIDSDKRNTATSSHGKMTLMPHLPNQIRVIIQEENAMLRRIEYLRRKDGPKAEGASSGGAELQRLAVVDVLVLSNDTTLDDGLFVLQPGRQEIVDHTDRYLDKLIPPQSH